MIEKANEKDLALYAFAGQLLEESIQEEGGVFKLALGMFRLSNMTLPLLDGVHCAVRAGRGRLGTWARRLAGAVSPATKKQQ